MTSLAYCFVGECNPIKCSLEANSNIARNSSKYMWFCKIIGLVLTTITKVVRENNDLSEVDTVLLK